MRKIINQVIKLVVVASWLITIIGFLFMYCHEYLWTASNGEKSINLNQDSKITSATVKYELDADGWGSVKLSNITDGEMSLNNAVGSIGSGVSIKSKHREVKKAKILFEYNEKEISDEESENYGIAYYNEEKQRTELLVSKVDTSEHTISVETEHFSEYIVVNTNEWYDAWLSSQLLIRDDKTTDFFDVMFAIDSSGSMEGEKNELSKISMRDFINELYDSDSFSVASFNDNINVLISRQEYKNANKDKVNELISGIEATGGTDINKALEQGIMNFKSDVSKNKLLILLSDGQSDVDENNLTEMLNADIKVITIGFGEDANNELLENIANSTGGKYYKASENNISDIFELIREEYLGVDLSQDSDGDMLPDKIEQIGMRNQYGNIICTNPNKKDTDGDGVSDGDEMGKVIVDENVSEIDRNQGITRYVYFLMKSNPLVNDSQKEKSGESATNYTKTVYIDADSLEDWQRQVQVQERSLQGIGNMITEYSGSTRWTGSIITGRTVLDYQTIEMDVPIGQGPLNDIKKIKLKLPSEIRYTLHKHKLNNFDMTEESIGKLLAGAVDNKIVITQKCGCGYSTEIEWTIPEPASKIETEPVYVINTTSRMIN